jgi:thiol-disulfide isomerase/thioredoxin
MVAYILLPLFLTFACKNNEVSNSSSNGPKLETASGASLAKDLEPVMGGPTNLKIDFSDPSINGTAKIIGFYSDQNFLADTALIKNGIMEYKNTKGLPQGIYYIGVNKRPEYLQIIMGKDQEMNLKVNLADALNSFVAEGSDENKIFYENMRYESTINPQVIDLTNKMKGLVATSPEYIALKKQRDVLEDGKMAAIKNLQKQYPDFLYPSYKYAGQNPKVKDELPDDKKVEAFRNEFWDNVNFGDTRLLRTPVIANKLKRYIQELTPQNAEAIVKSSKMLIDKTLSNPEYFKVFANYVVLSYEPGKSSVMDAENIFVSMVKSYFTKERAFWSDTLETNAIQQRATEMSQSLLGLKGPNVISTDNFGKKQELYSKTSEYVIVYMYNPECEHCMEQTPKLLKYWEANKASVDVFAIAIDTDDKKWKDYITKNGLAWTNVHDPSNRSIYGKYFVDVTPEIYILNKERKIIGKNLKVEQIQIIIDRDKQAKK